MSMWRSEQDFSRSIPEFIEKNQLDMTLGRKVWLGCWLLIALVSFSIGLVLVGLVALVMGVLVFQTHEGTLYQLVGEFPSNRRDMRSDAPFFEPPKAGDVVQLDDATGGVKAKSKVRNRDYRTPFTTIPTGMRVPSFGDDPKGILYDPTAGTDRFVISVRGWDLGNLDLAPRAQREAGLANVIKEALSELDGGIGFKYLIGSRPRNIYPYVHERLKIMRKEIVDALNPAPQDDTENSGDVEPHSSGAVGVLDFAPVSNVGEELDVEGDQPETILDVPAMEAEYFEELLAYEKQNTIDPIQVLEFEVPRPKSWEKALQERGYLTETEIENSPLVRVMRAVYDGLNSLEITGVQVLNMPGVLTHIRSNLDIGGIDEFHKAIHFAARTHEGEKKPWSQLFKDQGLWPKRIPKVGRNYVLTDQTLHRVVRLYRFRIHRVLPGFLDSLQLLQGKDKAWWFTFAYLGRSVSASKESTWLTRQIVYREGFQRAFRSGDRHETLEEKEQRKLPNQRQDDLYLSRGPAIRSNRYIVISVPLPALSDDVDEKEQLEIGLEIMRQAENQLRSKTRRYRIIYRVVKYRRQLERLSKILV